MSIIRTYAAEVVRLRAALRALDEWCPSMPLEPLRSEVAELLQPDRHVPVIGLEGIPNSVDTSGYPGGES